ncbi:uncharacterized protein BDW47DRAFT_119810 [Aspergillus candidus]|uniref:Uncharacterized protein n=1 Tax=Aspergillus candidus TaxID=41067 RepID=A0A2I2F3B2_ASPCN|nr:hypothetical protein BDW47DRAFT_119810 [Aspergillus candidus]PLB35121.1 hypothetical protein BDW47DRAFT_119810 [Aspergillus candidus]
MPTTSDGHWSWGFRLIISLRDDTYLAPDRPFDLSSSFDLCNFSMSKSTLVAVLRHLSLEPEFIETVTSLGDDSKVSFSLEDLDSQSLSYIMRTERALPSDLILAVRSTADDHHSFTTGFLHGCTENEAQHIVGWLKQASQALQEPTLMAFLLAEIQYERHTHITQEYWRRYDDLFFELQEKARVIAKLSPFTEDRTRDLPEIADWLSTIFAMHSKHGRMYRHFCTFQANIDLLQDLAEQSLQRQTTPLSPRFQTATSITHRLQQIATGYKDLEQQTLLLKEGSSLLLTTLWSLIAQSDSKRSQKANIINREIATSSRVIAKASGHDSSAMKALAVLTMVFLPGTTLATVFALPAFDWESHSFWPTARSSIWIFCALSAILTLLVLYTWRYWFLGTIWEKDAADGTNVSYRGLDRFLLRRHDRQKFTGYGDKKVVF